MSKDEREPSNPAAPAPAGPGSAASGSAGPGDAAGDAAGGPAGEPDGEAGPEAPVDFGLTGLALIAGFHQIPVNLENLRRQFAPAVSKLGEIPPCGDREIILAARSLGFKARSADLKLADLDNAFLPVLAKDRDGQYFIVAQEISEAGRPSAVARFSCAASERDTVTYIIYNLTPRPAPQKLNAAELQSRWDGAAILLTPRRSPFAALRKDFNLKWFIPSLVKYRRLFSEVLFASFLLQLFGLVTPLFFQVVMDKVLVHKALTTLDVLALGFLAASFFEVVLGGLRTYIFSHTTTRVDVELGARLFSHLVNLPLAWFQARQAGQSVARVRELDSLRNFITSTALTLVIDLGFTFVFFAVMYFYSPKLTLIVLASIPFYVALSVVITPILKHRLDQKFQHGAANQSFLVEAVTGVETIKSLALEPQMRKKWESLLADYVTAGFRAQNLGQVAGQVAGFLQKLTTLLIIWFGAHRVMEGDLTVGQLIAFNMIAGRVSGPILKLTQLWQDFQQAGISLKRLGDILNTPPEPGLDPGRGSLPALKGAVVLEKVRFRYRFDGPAVIADLSLEAQPGEIIGLVGPSGSGKSTLAKLIQRLYVPESGRVLVDGVDLALVDTAWLRQSVGVVLQDNFLFSGTVRENIALAEPGLSMERVVAAAKLAGAHDFILELPEGYDTQVGERGGGLSGGQRQRLAIARVLTGDPRILIFDEATSALDYESEQIIQNNMAAICRGRTVFIIAHRLSAVRLANRICVLEKGVMAESGPPQVLLARKGRFYQMVRSQSQATAPTNANPKPDAPANLNPKITKQ